MLVLIKLRTTNNPTGRPGQEFPLASQSPADTLTTPYANLISIFKDPAPFYADPTGADDHQEHVHGP